MSHTRPSEISDSGHKHDHWIRRCLDLARQGAGYVSPNPLVGSVIVSADQKVLGEGFHGHYGGPHAEVLAIDAVEEKHDSEVFRDTTLYVNLEPCSHHGKTPPCSDLIIKKGIPRVVIGMEDPFPAVAGSGIARLVDHGVEVTVGVLENRCKRLNEAYLHHLRTTRPLVTLKTAQTLDGRVATTSGDSRWITGTGSRQFVHQMRAEMDGILVGSATALADDPALTVRHVEGPQPQRFVLDRLGRLPTHLKMFSDEHTHRTCVIVRKDANPKYEKHLQKRGGRVIRLPERHGHLDLVDMVHVLGNSVETERGPLQSLLIEAGPSLATALFKDDLVDRYYCFIAPKLLGEGISSIGDLATHHLANALTFAESSWESVGPDMLFRGYRRPA